MRMRLVGLALGLAAATTAGAGVVMHMAEKDLASGKQSDHEVWYLQGGMMRVDTLDDRGHIRRMSMLRDSAIWEFDVEKRTYSKLDKAAMQAQMAYANDKMKEMMAKMPPERRAQMEQAMKNMQQPKHHEYTWTDAGRSDRAGPYSCHVWEGRHDNKVSEEVCVAPTGSLPGGDELVATMRQALTVVRDVMSGTPMAGAAFSDFAKRYEQMNGFPVLTRHMSNGKAYRETLVTAVDRQAVPGDKFEIPKGFTEKPFGKHGADGDE
jgi:hypothetical protein